MNSTVTARARTRALVGQLAKHTGSSSSALFELRYLAGHALLTSSPHCRDHTDPPAAKALDAATPSLTHLHLTLSRFTAAQWTKLSSLANDRVESRKPLQYILGTVPFGRDLDLRVAPPVLIPRWETDEWTERLARMVAPAGVARVRVADLCSGSGCVSLALHSHLHPQTQVEVTGYDVHPAALSLARENAARNSAPSAEYHALDLLAASALPHPADLVVANPPYIRANEYPDLDPDVRDWEDVGALVSGPDGVEFYSKLAALARDALRSTSLPPTCPTFATEIGHTQGAAVRAILLDAGFAWADVWKDMAGKDRCVVAGQ
ncbi:hypothetical protein H9P43_009068 [Blastocladiella emersonii ATCC 22665]|nr:hypothetical protein H9P43_009068 [Blastocladiella emersonii ATCC 22665]